MQKRQDVIIGLGILVGVGILFYETLNIPAPRFEPMGSALLPQFVLGAMGILAMALVIQGLRKTGSRECHHEDCVHVEQVLIEEAEHRNVPNNPAFNRAVLWRTLVTLLSFAAYTAVLNFEMVNYYTATAVFTVGLTAYLSNGNKKDTLTGAATVLVVLGLLYTLTRIMGLILPST